jgi:hypothetical protein
MAIIHAPGGRDACEAERRLFNFVFKLFKIQDKHTGIALPYHYCFLICSSATKKPVYFLSKQEQ